MRPTDTQKPPGTQDRTATMSCFAQRYATAAPAATACTRARVAVGGTRGNALMANGSWSIRSAFVMPTTDHKHEPRRLTVIPT